jgi:predicted enzyme related to lactoylglutathione lyase
MTTAAGAPTRPWSGLSGGHAEAVVVPTFTVADAAAAATAVRAAGGEAGEVTPTRDGATVRCSDDQGAPFALVEP